MNIFAGLVASMLCLVINSAAFAQSEEGNAQTSEATPAADVPPPAVHKTDIPQAIDTKQKVPKPKTTKSKRHRARREKKHNDSK